MRACARARLVSNPQTCAWACLVRTVSQAASVNFISFIRRPATRETQQATSVSHHARCLVRDQVHFNVENKMCSAIIFNDNQTVVTSKKKKWMIWKKKPLDINVGSLLVFDSLLMILSC